MRIERGNRKVVQVAMMVTAIVVCFCFACAVHASDALLVTAVAGICATGGAGMRANVATHKVQSEKGTQLE